MVMNTKYPQKIKQRVLEEYNMGKTGYKSLARKYCLTRDLVREWVLNKKIQEEEKIKVRN